MKTMRYCLLDRELYRIAYLGPLMRCLRPKSALKVMGKMHERLYGSHLSGRSVSRRIILHGYYWLTILKDLEKYVRERDKCQKFSPINHIPANDLSIVFNLWPFIKWGLGIVGQLPQVLAQNKFILMATNYFSK